MVFGFFIRSGMLFGTIYYTKKFGVWGTSYETEKLYDDIKGGLRPVMKKVEKQMGVDFPALPNSGEITYITKHFYNAGVKRTFNFVEMLPSYTFQMVNKVKSKFEEFAKSPTPSREI